MKNRDEYRVLEDDIKVCSGEYGEEEDYEEGDECKGCRYEDRCGNALGICMQV